MPRRSPMPMARSSMPRTRSPAAFPASTRCCGGRGCWTGSGVSIRRRPYRPGRARRSIASIAIIRSSTTMPSCWSMSTSGCGSRPLIPRFKLEPSIRLGEPRELSNPALRRTLFETRPECPEICDARVEHHCVFADRPTAHERRNLVARGALHRTGLGSVEHTATPHHACTNLLLQSLKHPEEPVDGAPGGARRRLIHPHDQEALVAKLAGHREWRAMRLPVCQVRIHSVEEGGRALLGEWFIPSEYPDARRIG